MRAAAQKKIMVPKNNSKIFRTWFIATHESTRILCEHGPLLGHCLQETKVSILASQLPCPRHCPHQQPKRLPRGRQRSVDRSDHTFLGWCGGAPCLGAPITSCCEHAIAAGDCDICDSSLLKMIPSNSM